MANSLLIQDILLYDFDVNPPANILMISGNSDFSRQVKKTKGKRL